MRTILGVLVPLWLISILCGCDRQGTTASGSTAPTNRVTLYCSVDEVYAKPIIHDLEKKTGLQIAVLYDTEAAKTAGLANRIRAEKNRPQGDVFWSSALLQTLLLKREGLLQPYKSPSAKDIPAAFKDPQGAWTGLGGRARVVVFHDNFWGGAPTLPTLSVDFLKNKVGISNPQFGTASDWVAALATRWGVPKTLNYFRALKTNGVQVLPGNSVVAEKVRRGELRIGVTDSDDYLAQQKKPGSIFATQIKGWDKDTVLVPGSVAMLHSAPNTEAGRKLMDALLSRDTEQKLMQQMPGVYGLRGQRTPKETRAITVEGSLVHAAPNDTARWPAAWDKIREPLAQTLLSD